MVVLSLSGNIIMAQDVNKKMFDEKSQKNILVGICTREGLLSCPFAEDYYLEYPAYKPDEAVLNEFKGLFSEISCVLVLGTWCGDSKEQVPRFFKILDLSETQFESFEIFCVDRNKEAEGMDVKTKCNIEKVPTFIFYKGEKEIGRIIETPVNSLEKDMLEILSN